MGNIEVGMSRGLRYFAALFFWCLFLLLSCGEQTNEGPFDEGATYTSWAVPYGGEFWRRTHTVAEQSPSSVGVGEISSELDVSDVIDRVSHSVRSRPPFKDPGIVSRNYLAEFTSVGMRFSPRIRDQRQDQTHATFRTISVTRGVKTVYESDGSILSWMIEGNTAQLLLDMTSGIVEHHEGLEEGVHVSWFIPSEPSGTDLLRIEAELDGMSFFGETSAGIQFSDDSGTARIRLGRVTVVDSIGNQWNVPVSVEAGVIAIEVPEDILEEASYPIAVDPVISAELLVGELISSPSMAFPSDVGFDGTVYLVTWVNDTSLRGTRVDIDGNILDPFGFDIPGSSCGNGSYPLVATNGSYFLVVYRRDAAIQYITVNGADGSIQQPPKTLVSADEGLRGRHSISSDGNNFLVTWEDGRGFSNTGVDIYAARIRGSDGTVLDVGGFPIYVGPDNQYNPHVAWGGGSYLIAWWTYPGGSVSGQRVRASDGALLNPGGISIPGYRYASVASDGDDFLVVSGYSGSVFGARVSGADGSLIDPTAVEIGDTGGATTHASVAWGANDYYLVSWQKGPNNEIHATRVSSSDLSVIDADGIPIGTSTSAVGFHSIASDGNNFLVVWKGDDNYLHGTRVRIADGTVLDPSGIEIGLSPNTQRLPSVASNGTYWLIVWVDYRDYDISEETDLYGVRVRESDGVVLDPPGIAVCTASGDQGSPSVASNGTDFFVAWEDYRNWSVTDVDIYGARVRGVDGLVLDQDGIPVSTAESHQQQPYIASNGTDYFVVWPDRRNGSSSQNDVYGARIEGSSGLVMDPDGIEIAPGPGNSVGVITSDGTNYCVAWASLEPATGSENSVNAIRILAQDGSLLDPGGIQLATSNRNLRNVSIASDGSRYLVAWDNEFMEINGVRINGSDGSVIDPSPFILESPDSYNQLPVVASDGDMFLLVWVDHRNFEDNCYDIYYTTIHGSDGVITDPLGKILSSEPASETSPSVSFGGSKFLVAYESVEKGAVRVKTRTMLLDYCTILGEQIPGDTRNPQNQCQACVPSISDSGWTDIEGQSCDDGSYCTVEDVCVSGSCVGAPRDCRESVRFPVCQDPMCDDDADRCSTVSKNEGFQCDDGHYCTVDNTCRSGHCIGTARDCSLEEDEPQCQRSMCDDAGRRCIVEPDWMAYSCDDGEYCTEHDRCLAGDCVGVVPRDCRDFVEEPRCQVVRCDEEVDACIADPVNEGLSCDDGEFCTDTDICRSGVCVVLSEHRCSEFLTEPQCQIAVCDEEEDACGIFPHNEGNPCSDGYFCTTGDTCREGACVGGETLDCSGAVTEPQCQIGICDDWRGLCVAEPVNEGEKCEAHGLCIGEAVCRNGKCIGHDICSTDGGGCACGSTTGAESCAFCYIYILAMLALMRRDEPML
jgi:hypothetical protein